MRRIMLTAVGIAAVLTGSVAVRVAAAAGDGAAGCPPYTATSTYAACGFPTAETTGVPGLTRQHVTIRNSVITSNSWWGIRFGGTDGRTNLTGLTVAHNRITSIPRRGPDAGPRAGTPVEP